jgi:hypothetical protein
MRSLLVTASMRPPNHSKKACSKAGYRLSSFLWPNNLRELENIATRHLSDTLRMRSDWTVLGVADALPGFRSRIVFRPKSAGHMAVLSKLCPSGRNPHYVITPPTTSPVIEQI